jgi:hypothetical protein
MVCEATLQVGSEDAMSGLPSWRVHRYGTKPRTFLNKFWEVTLFKSDFRNRSVYSSIFEKYN